MFGDTLKIVRRSLILMLKEYKAILKSMLGFLLFQIKKRISKHSLIVYKRLCLFHRFYESQTVPQPNQMRHTRPVVRRLRKYDHHVFCSHRLGARTPPSQGENVGSNPIGNTNMRDKQLRKSTSLSMPGLALRLIDARKRLL